MNIDPRPSWARTGAIVGAFVWCGALFFRLADAKETDLIEKILLLGVLVIVPLGLSLLGPAQQEGSHSWFYRLAILIQPLGAAAVVVSFFLAQGPEAALLASLWLVVEGLIALYGLSRLRLRELRTTAELAIDVGLIYLPIGGAWLMMSRLGLRPLGFGDTIVLLTAVHFHFAGYAAPILTGLAGRVLIHAPANIRRAFTLSAIGVTTGTPLIAAGITFSPSLGLIGTLLITFSLMLLGMLVVGWVVPMLRSRAAQLLLVLSSVSSFVSMVLACFYSYSLVAKELIIDIPQMALTHGLMNALGFSLCGLAAWALVRD